MNQTLIDGTAWTTNYRVHNGENGDSSNLNRAVDAVKSEIDEIWRNLWVTNSPGAIRDPIAPQQLIMDNITVPLLNPVEQTYSANFLENTWVLNGGTFDGTPQVYLMQKPTAKQLNNSYAQSTYVQWGSDFLPDIWQAAQTFLIPNIGLSHPEYGGRAGAKVKFQADTVVWSPLIMDIMLDNEFQLYNIIYDNFIRHLDVEKGVYAPAPFDVWCSVIGVDGEEICKWSFHNVRIEDVSELSVNINEMDEPLKLTLTCVFDYMDFHKNS